MPSPHHQYSTISPDAHEKERKDEIKIAEGADKIAALLGELDLDPTDYPEPDLSPDDGEMVEVAATDLPPPPSSSSSSWRAELERRKSLLDSWLALDGRPQRKLRPHRDRILAGWLELARFRHLNGREPTGGEFCELRKISRNSALKLLKRLRELEGSGPWAL